jgi:hypothetical protein
VAPFESWFEDKSVDLDNAEHWFQVDVVGIANNAPASSTPPHGEGAMMTNAELISEIRQLGGQDTRILGLLDQATGWAECHHQRAQDGIVYTRGRIEVPDKQRIKTAIVRSQHDHHLAGHPGRAKTLALVQRCFTWPSMKKFVNQYVDGCDSCQRVKARTQKTFGTLEPLPIPAAPWMDISYDMITDLPKSCDFDSMLTVVDQLTKMAHFIPCTKTMTAEDLARLMVVNV